jgi:hypothetical protein
MCALGSDLKFCTDQQQNPASATSTGSGAPSTSNSASSSTSISSSSLAGTSSTAGGASTGNASTKPTSGIYPSATAIITNAAAAWNVPFLPCVALVFVFSL